jgi:hypothetical protein
MHVYDRFRSLAGCFSIYLLAFACTKREYCLCIQNLNPKLFQMSPPYLPICGITLPFQVNLHVPPLNIQMNICFVCPYRSWSDRGWSVSSMLSGLFSDECLFTCHCTRGAGNWDAQSRNQNKKNIMQTNSPRNLIVWRAPVNSASHGLCWYGGGGVNFTFPLGNRL